MYKVTIVKIENKIQETEEWKPKFTDDVYEGMKETGTAPDSQYGYVTKKEEKETVTQVLEQRIEDVDLKKVVAVINGIDMK